MDETDSTKPKAKTEGDVPTKKVEGDAYEVDSMIRHPKYDGRGDRLMSPHDFKQLRMEMQKIGVILKIDLRGEVLKGTHVGGYSSELKTIYLKPKATRYQAFHETQHAKQNAKLGDEAYRKQTITEKETYVRDKIIENKEMFSDNELTHAEAYLRDVKVREAAKLRATKK